MSLEMELQMTRASQAEELREEFPGWRFTWDGYWKAARTMPQGKALRRGLAMNVWEDERLALPFQAFLEELRSEQRKEKESDDEE